MERHPYMGSLVKRVISIVVTWNVVMACLIATVVSIGVFLAISAGFSSAASPYTSIYGNGYSQLLSIKVNGVMLGSSGSDDAFSFFADDSQTYGYDVKDQLYIAAEDPSIAGVILEIDSPGGTIYGATAIADGVKHYREATGKAVYAHIEGLGASAAYWAAASADKVFADHGSSIGSIGVLMGPFEYYDTVVATNGGLFGGGVITQNGIQSTYLTAGKSKDVGNPYRKLTAEETAILQKTVNNEYDGFVRYVSQRRAISETAIRNQIGAMIYDTKSAAELRLIDSVGSRQQAYDALAEAAKVPDYTVIREYYEPGLADILLGAINRKPQPKAADLCALTRGILAYHGDITAWCARD